jgi:hypothetical protein
LPDLLNQGRKKTGRVGCPDDESLASYLTGLYSEHAEEGMERHLVDCSLCLEDLVAVYKASQDKEAEGVPQGIIDRVMALVPPTQGEQGLLDLVVRLAKGSLELMRTSGQWVDPFATARVGIRGRPKPSESSILQVEKEIGKFKVAVEVELVETGLCQVVVRFKGEEGRPAEGIRVSLISGAREQASYLTRLGEAVFDRIPLGEYNLAISDSGTPVGTVRLQLTE